MSVDDQAVYKDLPSLVMQRPMKVHYKGDETVPSELVTRIAHVSDYRVCISERPATLQLRACLVLLCLYKPSYPRPLDGLYWPSM